MPPKIKYTKEEIGNAALMLVRENGIDSLSARSLAARLGTSTAPIFTAFVNIEEVRDFVLKKAQSLFMEYLEKGLSFDIPFKGSAMMYIRFAVEEREFFKLLFMSTRKAGEPSGFFPGENPVSEKILSNISNIYFKNDTLTRKLYNHLSVYVHGIAVSFAQGSSHISLEDADTMIREAFFAFKEKFDEHN